MKAIEIFFTYMGRQLVPKGNKCKSDGVVYATDDGNWIYQGGRWSAYDGPQPSGAEFAQMRGDELYVPALRVQQFISEAEELAAQLQQAMKHKDGKANEAVETFVQCIGGPLRPAGHKCDVVGMVYRDASSSWQYTESGWQLYNGDRPQGMFTSIHGEFELYIPKDKTHQFAMELDELAAQLTVAIRSREESPDDIWAAYGGAEFYKWNGTEFHYEGTTSDGNVPMAVPLATIVQDNGVVYYASTAAAPDGKLYIPLYSSMLQRVRNARKARKKPMFSLEPDRPEFAQAAESFASAMAVSFTPMQLPNCDGLLMKAPGGRLFTRQGGNWRTSYDAILFKHWVCSGDVTVYIPDELMDTFCACAMAIGADIQAALRGQCMEAGAESKFQEIVHRLMQRGYSTAWLQDADGHIYVYCDGKWGVAASKPSGEFRSYQHNGFTFGFKDGMDDSKALSDFEAQILS